MSDDKREVVHVETRMTISEEDLETAFQGCDDVFWAKALESFPEVQSGDTEPMATMTYSETVKAFMKPWLENAPIMVGGLTEDDAEALAEHVVEGGFNFAGDDGDFLIAVEGSGDPMTVKVVEIRHKDQPQGFAVQVGDEIAKTTGLARNMAQLEYAIEDVTNAIKKRIDQ